MRAVVQRVSRAQVRIEGEVVGRIGVGLLVLLAIREGDGADEVAYLADKLLHLRIFPDENDKMNRSVTDAGGGMLVVSQFTLYADCRKGRRPSFIGAAAGDVAVGLYESFIERLRHSGLVVETGRFGAMMEVELTNDGPVTLILDSPA